MVKKSTLLYIIPATLAMTACVDNDYDLADVDTTVSLSATQVTIPINIDSITLDAILDLSDDSRIKKVNGEYAVVEEGTFSSSPIHIPSFTASPKTINPIKDDLPIKLNISSDASEDVAVPIDADELLFSYDITDEKTSVDINATNVDEAIVSIDHVGVVDGLITAILAFDGMSSVANESLIEDLELQLMQGLDLTPNIGTYESSTGILSVPSVAMTNHKLTLTLEIDGIGSESGMAIDESHNFNLSADMFVKNGKVSVYVSNIKSKYFDGSGNVYLARLINDAPQSVGYSCNVDITDIEVEMFSGTVRYDIEDIDIDPVEMNDLPDVLSQSGTDIKLENPQIYLSMNNPVGEYDLSVTTGLQMVSHTGSSSAAYTLDKELDIDEEENMFCLSPKVPDVYYSGTVDGQAVDFASCEHATFSDLGEVLSGDGLPDYLDIFVVDPQVPEQSVTSFRLGEDLDKVDGLYVFYAPLQLTADAKIVYTDTFDGWNDEDVDAVVISEVNVTATISTDIPLELDIKVYPIDVAGNKITDNGEVVYGYTTANVTPGTDEPLEVKVSGTVTHLDGIILEARVTGTDETDSALEPTQAIVLKNIRATVSGSYEKEL